MCSTTQNQALAAILFLYRFVLNQEAPWLGGLVRAKVSRRLPIVLSRSEVSDFLGHLDGVPQLVAMLLYGSGLRLMECLQLRVKDLDFKRHTLTIRGGKGDKDRNTVIPRMLIPKLQAHLKMVKDQHLLDLKAQAGWVALPYALERKYPYAGKEWAWQWVFPATRFYYHAQSLQRRRHHLHETVIQKAIKQAIVSADISKPASCHTLRHSFATHLLGWM